MILVNDRENPYRFNICITCFKYYEKDQLKFTFKFQGQKEKTPLERIYHTAGTCLNRSHDPGLDPLQRAAAEPVLHGA